MKKILLIATVLSSFIACNSDDDPTPKTTTPPINQRVQMILVKDGDTSEVKNMNNTLLFETQQGEKGRRLDLRCNIDGGTLVLTASNWDWQLPPLNGLLRKIYETNTFDNMTSHVKCKEMNSITYCDGGLATYIKGFTIYTSEGMDDEALGHITINENDNVNKTVSGTFDVIVYDFVDEKKITYSGTFTKAAYTVMK